MKKNLKLSLIVIGIMFVFGIFGGTSVNATEYKSFKVSKEIFEYLTGRSGYGLGGANTMYKYENTLLNSIGDLGTLGLSKTDIKQIRELSDSSTYTLKMTIEQFNAIKEISIFGDSDERSDNPLYGIENFSNLTSLSIDETGYDLSLDLTQIEKLTKLKKIEMFVVNADLTPIAKLQNLEYIAIVSNIYKMTSLDFISHPEKLKLLNLSLTSNVIDLNKLKDSKDLLYLSIQDDQNLKDISAISNLTNLVFISFSNCKKLEDISALRNLSNLQYVNFDNCEKLKDISALKKSSKNLGVVNLNYTSVSDISVLKDAVADEHYINKYSFSGCKITDFSTVIDLLNNFKSYSNLYMGEYNITLAKFSESDGYLEFTAAAQKLQVTTKSKEYTLPAVFQQALLDEFAYNDDYSKLTDYGSWDKAGNFVEYGTERKLDGVTIEIAGGTLSQDNTKAIFPNNVKEGDTMCVAVNGGLLNDTHIVITYGDELKLGDINKDTKIDINDAILILKHVTGKEKFTDSQIKAADVTKDGKVNIQDAITILKKIVGKIKEF